MATISKSYDALIALLDSFLHNPSRTFIKPSDLAQYANAAAIDVAMEIGGIPFIDTALTSAASQRDYTPNNQYFKILKAHYVRNINTDTEQATPLDVISQTDRDFIDRISSLGVSPDNWSLAVANTAQDKPKYLIYWQETSTIRLVETPAVTGDTLKLWVRGLPASLASGVDYSGSTMEMLAIAFRMAQLGRMKSRETQESTFFDNMFTSQIARIRRARGKIKQVRQIQDGRYQSTRLRSVNGAK